MSISEELLAQPARRMDALGHDDFERLTEPHRRELLVHCYRMLGSLEDAEDALQETMLRAWRRLDSLKDQAALRPWLYRIATNVCLDGLNRRKTRLLPNALVPAADPEAALPAAIDDPIWLGPLPDSYLAPSWSTPAARYETLESVTLAFLTALQRLPGRQRAVLLLRDVLGWRSQEVAEMLEQSVAAVNSALQRARATLHRLQEERAFASTTRTEDAATAALLKRYVQAWESSDPVALLALLREDALLTMPPLPAWFRGRAAIHQFYARQLFAGAAAGRFRLLATRANGGPAFAIYERAAGDGAYLPSALQVLTLAEGQIQRLDTWLAPDAWLCARFQLPNTI